MTNILKIRSLVLVLLTLSLSGLTACAGDLLDVQDPDLVTPDNVQGEKGADLFWAGALGAFAEAYSSGTNGNAAIYVGMFTDEFILSGTFPTRFEIDSRDIDESNGTIDNVYINLHQARVGLENAAEVLEEFLPGDSRIAEMYGLAGYTYIMFGENYCEGVPYGATPRTGDIVQGTPTTRDETFALATARFASAAASAAGSADFENLARVGQARVLLNQGNFAGAGAEVAAVPDAFEYLVRSKGGGAARQRNSWFEFNQSQRRWSLSDAEGGTGIPFRTAADPRVPWVDNGGIGFDEETALFEQLKYDSWDADVVLANGIEARLIEAEAALNASDPGGMVTALNLLRTNGGLAGDLTDPGTLDAQVDLLFSERAM
ncbi:MAG: hypothetical protein ACR2QM_18195, partial [Longimicrobiales bacterium]